MDPEDPERGHGRQSPGTRDRTPADRRGTHEKLRRNPVTHRWGCDHDDRKTRGRGDKRGERGGKRMSGREGRQDAKRGRVEGILSARTVLHNLRRDNHPQVPTTGLTPQILICCTEHISGRI